MISNVTVVIPTRNRPEMTIEAATSALRAVSPPLRVIVLDAGSADHNIEKLEQLPAGAELHRGVFKNAAQARNAGATLVESSIIGFLDSDDRMHPERITCLEALLENHTGASMAIGRTDVIDADGSPLSETSDWLQGQYDQSEEAGLDYAGQAIKSTAYTSATLIRRMAFEAVGGYDEDLETMEDWDLYLRLSIVGEVIGSHCTAASYRLWEGNVDARRSALGSLAVARKHLANPPSLSDEDRRRATYALLLRAATSLQTLMRGREAREMLIQALRVWPGHAMRDATYRRLAISTAVPRHIVSWRRAAFGS